MNYLEIAAKMLNTKVEFLHEALVSDLKAVNSLSEKAGSKLESRQAIAVVIVNWQNTIA